MIAIKKFISELFFGVTRCNSLQEEIAEKFGLLRTMIDKNAYLMSPLCGIIHARRLWMKLRKVYIPAETLSDRG